MCENLEQMQNIMTTQEEYPGYDHKVQYYETDQMGCVHHSNYIRWFEEIRSDYLDYLDMGYDQMEKAGIISPVLSISAEYKTMTRYGETPHITVRVKEYNGIRIRLAYTVTDKETGVVRCTGESSHCFLNLSGRPVTLKKAQPQWHARMLEELENS